MSGKRSWCISEVMARRGNPSPHLLLRKLRFPLPRGRAAPCGEGTGMADGKGSPQTVPV